MANAMQSLAEIFNKRLFRIPDYKGYAQALAFARVHSVRTGLRSAPQWTAPDIQARGLELPKSIEKKWCIALGAEQTNLRLLKTDN